MVDFRNPLCSKGQALRLQGSRVVDFHSPLCSKGQASRFPSGHSVDFRIHARKGQVSRFPSSHSVDFRIHACSQGSLSGLSHPCPQQRSGVEVPIQSLSGLPHPCPQQRSGVEVPVQSLSVRRRGSRSGQAHMSQVTQVPRCHSRMLGQTQGDLALGDHTLGCLQSCFRLGRERGRSGIPRCISDIRRFSSIPARSVNE